MSHVVLLSSLLINDPPHRCFIPSSQHSLCFSFPVLGSRYSTSSSSSSSAGFTGSHYYNFEFLPTVLLLFVLDFYPTQATNKTLEMKEKEKI
jgi:hypothetical protein